MDPVNLLKHATNARYKNLTYDKRDPTATLNQITYLSLDRKNIEKIENLQYCTQLSCLFLSDNLITNIAKAFTGYNFKNLFQLSLDGNRIHKIEGLESLINLKKLYLENNFISRLEGL